MTWQPSFDTATGFRIDGRLHLVLTTMSEAHVVPVRDDGTLAVGEGWTADHSGAYWMFEPLHTVQAVLPLACGLRVVSGRTVLDLQQGSSQARMRPLGAPWADPDRSFHVELATEVEGVAVIVWVATVDGRLTAGLARVEPDGALTRFGDPFATADRPEQPYQVLLPVEGCSLSNED